MNGSSTRQPYSGCLARSRLVAVAMRRSKRRGTSSGATAGLGLATFGGGAGAEPRPRPPAAFSGIHSLGLGNDLRPLGETSDFGAQSARVRVSSAPSFAIAPCCCNCCTGRHRPALTCARRSSGRRAACSNSPGRRADRPYTPPRPVPVCANSWRTGRSSLQATDRYATSTAPTTPTGATRQSPLPTAFPATHTSLPVRRPACSYGRGARLGGQRRSTPPSTGSATLVMQRAREERRKSAASATSSGDKTPTLSGLARHRRVGKVSHVGLSRSGRTAP